MNIKEAKEEILHTIRIYLRKDEKGRYVMPAVRQRPLLLIGPPGIGKTAIMEQAARESGIGLVAYTITHHTRQSAVGLPMIVTRNYQGKEYSITRYTMSEIIASVYECMENTGCHEGILFIDEINCVSETLVPTMLQFLQNKTFGTHPVPAGWIIIAAGNPEEYNKSAREFDIVTLDRVRRMDITPDLDVWMEYARSKSLHPAIISYLSLKRDRFYHIEETAEGPRFVTARGWEDLSSVLSGYEDLELPPDEELVFQFLQEPDTARDFSAYYQLYAKYRMDYRIADVLTDSLSQEELQKRCRMVQNASPDERLTVAGLLMEGWNGFLNKYSEEDRFNIRLKEVLENAKAALLRGETLQHFIDSARNAHKIKEENQLANPAEARLEDRILKTLDDCLAEARRNRHTAPDAVIEILKNTLAQADGARSATAARTALALERGYRFAEDAFGDGAELLFLTAGLSHNPGAVAFISTFGCDAYFRHSDKLMFREKRQALLDKIDTLAETASPDKTEKP